MKNIRDIAVVSVGRSDYSILKPVLLALKNSAKFKLNLLVTGMHLSPEFGLTVQEIESDGWEITEKIESIISSGTPSSIAKSIGIGTIGFADVFARSRPDILIIMGDRFEMFAAALAALPFSIPIAHIHGGETTEGALDEVFRHSITKMSHFHFVTTDEHKKRVEQLGEEPSSIYLCGAPGLDNLINFKQIDINLLNRKTGIVVEQKPIVVTYHPETIDQSKNLSNLHEIFLALEEQSSQVIFTASNADIMGSELNKNISEKCAGTRHFHFVPNLGSDTYYQLMSRAGALVGNSSSGIIEAASFKIPVLNLGDRQKGRVRGLNVIDVNCDKDMILKALQQVSAPGFERLMKGLINPYFHGGSAKIICDALEKAVISTTTLKKKFHDLH